jgi:hypothetical protein
MKLPLTWSKKTILLLYCIFCLSFLWVAFNRQTAFKQPITFISLIDQSKTHATLSPSVHADSTHSLIEEDHESTANASSSRTPSKNNEVTVDLKNAIRLRHELLSSDDPIRSSLDILREALSKSPINNKQSLGKNAFLRAESLASATSTAKILDSFAILQANILAGKSPPRFIAWKVTSKTSGAGLGNRVLGVISALVLAIASNRAFIIADDDILSSTLEAVPIIEGGIDMSVSSARAIAPTFDEMHPLAWGLGMDSKCGCDDYTKPPLSNIVTISMETTQYLVPCFSHNPSLRTIILDAFGPTTAAFRPLMQRFFRLNSQLRKELARFGMELHPPRLSNEPRRHVIGLQIRTGHLIRPRSEESTFYRCAQQLGALAQLGRSAVTRDSAFFERSPIDALDAIEYYLLDTKLNTESLPSAIDIYYFIATDSEKVRERARNILGKDRVLTYSGTGSSAAVIDTWALSLCDDVILTYPKSTFGFVGASLSVSGLPPHVVISGSKTLSECVRLTSTEPVFHGWFMRWFANCYSREWETGDMLNQDNAYFCLMQPSSSPPSSWGTHVCPASDSADGMLFVQSPFDYEGLDEVGDSESFFGDVNVKRRDLMSRFEKPYEEFIKRAGPPVYGYEKVTRTPIF